LAGCLVGGRLWRKVAMKESNASGRVVKFGIFEADLSARELRKSGARLRLQDQPFQVLALLLENAGRIVTRDDLREKLWPGDTFVDFDKGLNTAINKIREALGDSAESPRFVETLPRRGYRFLTVSADQRSSAIHSLAVLPLENLSHDPEQEYFADGLTEALISTLARIGALRVVSRTTAMHYKGVHRQLREIARELDVDAIVEGIVARSGDRVRISVQLIQASTDGLLWADSYERDLRDVLVLQAEVAGAIAKEIQVKLTPEEQAQLRRTRRVDADAYELYLQGRYHWNKRNLGGLTKGAEYFQKAVDCDPTYAAAYAGLADSASRLGFWMDATPEEGCARGKAAALKAIELDDSLSEAHAALCYASVHYDFNISVAERAARRAIELNPRSEFALQGGALCLMQRGRAEDATAEILRAVQIEPRSMVLQWNAATFLWFARQYDQSISQTQKILELDSNAAQAHWILALNLVQKKKYDDAVEAMQQTVQISGPAPFYLGALGYVYAVAGSRDDALRVMNELHELSKRRHVSPHWIGLIYAALDEKDKAFLWLDRAHQEHAPWIAYAKAIPWFDNLRSDARFYCLLQRMNIPI
jgi:TolB-like protein/Flp pilus assembly protein TadD